MNIGIIDADLLNKKKHRFPNLASMKISSYYKKTNNFVQLLMSYDDIKKYDKVFISKVFTETKVPEEVLDLNNVEFGGTGFYYDKAPFLPYEIEHSFPDYSLYDDWVESMLNKGSKRKEFEYYLDYSIGYTTRGCFRGCEFCVNKNFKKVELHSKLSEFLDKNKKYICLLDDNVLGASQWKSIFDDLVNTKKPFQYKQGLDERILTREKCEVLTKCKYKGHYIFAFDNIEDSKLIETKLRMWREYTHKKSLFYVFCGFDRNNKWDKEFWIQDIIDVFKRIEILMKYKAYPYIMRFKDYEKSLYRGMYINLARWCNQPNIFDKMSFREFCMANAKRKNDDKSATIRYMKEFEKNHPEIAEKYFNLKLNN
jgi:hypothetical protein